MAHPGLRIGWLAGPKEIIDQAWHRHDYTSISTGIISQRVAEIILQPDRREGILNRGRDLLRSNVPIVETWVRQHAENFSFIPPKAGGMAFVRYDLPINSSELVTKLRVEKDVLVVAGDWFGMDGYLRFGIGSETNYLIEGLELIDGFLRDFAA